MILIMLKHAVLIFKTCSLSPRLKDNFWHPISCLCNDFQRGCPRWIPVKNGTGMNYPCVINPKTILWAGFLRLVPAYRIAPGNIAQLTFSTCICLLDRYKRQLPDWEMLHHNQPSISLFPLLAFSIQRTLICPGCLPLLPFSTLAFILWLPYFLCLPRPPSFCLLFSLSVIMIAS